MLSPTADKVLQDAVASGADNEDDQMVSTIGPATLSPVAVAPAGAVPDSASLKSPPTLNVTAPQEDNGLATATSAPQPDPPIPADAVAAPASNATSTWLLPPQDADIAGVTPSTTAAQAASTTTAPAASAPQPPRKRAKKQHAIKGLQMQPPRSDQNKIRAFLQSLPEDHFMIWGYALETERQRRTQLRQQLQPKKAGKNTPVIDPVQQALDAATNAAMMSAAQAEPMAAATLPIEPEHPAAAAITGGVDLNVPQHQAPLQDQKKGDEKKRVHRHDLAWSQRFQELLDYRVQHGHCDVPDEAIPQLSKWVQSQRQHYKRRLRGDKNSMTDERMSKLKNIGFRFAIKDDFDTRYNQLLEFKAMYGHTRVPQHYVELNKLGTWVKGQRAAYRHLKSGKQNKTSNHCKLDEERIQKLNDIGFEWVVKKRVE